MKRYLETTFDWRTQEIANIYDELPFWSAPFGGLLLDNVPFKAYKTFLDVGFGAGFPLIDLAQRLGEQCSAFGVDSWSAAVARAKDKVEVLKLDSIKIIEGDASALEFENSSMDLVTSSLGINNFENPKAVLKECHRVLSNDGVFACTSNLNGTFEEFYNIFQKTIVELKLDDYLDPFHEHVNHRGTRESLSNLLEESGFSIIRTIEDTFTMRYLNGSAFLNHSLVMVGFNTPWKELFPFDERERFFDKFEKNLNEYSAKAGELKLTIPMIYFECNR
ncbi:MAG: class I SAM-dependent methyltransferase [Proteobacteria bacterium]|nr:class I SAM-dependent methyltransferase [Pseudomonadota bacterium]